MGSSLLLRYYMNGDVGAILATLASVVVLRQVYEAILGRGGDLAPNTS